MGQLTSSDFQTYPTNVNQDDAITPGPVALYEVPVDQIAPTQMNEGLTEVGKKSAGFDLDGTPAALQADLLTDIEPVVIGPGGQLYLLDGHHTFTALLDSVYGASDPTVFVDIVANLSSLSISQFFATMQANNLLLPLNDGVPQTVNDATGAPIPTQLTALTSDPYRGLEYSILKNKSSKLFTAASNITGLAGASTPGLDKMTGFYSDFLEAAAYRDADSGLGLPYLSPGDIALATRWNLTATSPTTLPNVIGTVDAGQLPGFILSGNILITGTVSNATLAHGALDGTATGTFDESSTFASFNGITEINAGTGANPIVIGTPNVGFIMQLGTDNDALAGGMSTYNDSVTLTGSNSYTGGTSILAGNLIVPNDAALGAAPTETTAAFLSGLVLNASGFPTNVVAAVQADNGIIFNSLTEGNGTLTIGPSTGSTFSTSRPIAVGGETATINVNGNAVTLNGPLVSLGVDSDGIGNADGVSDLSIDDDSSADNGSLILSTASPDFFGNIIIGVNGKPIVRVTSDAALGSTSGLMTGSGQTIIGEVELNGGTFQAGASFTSVRSFSVQSKSTFDTGGFTTSFAGALSDNQRNLTITNSNISTTGAGAVTFGAFDIGSALELTLSKGSGTSTSVTFTNGIQQTSSSDQLLLALGSSTTLFTGSAPALTNGIAPPWIVMDSGASSNPYDFATYTGGGGFAAFTGYATSITTSTSTSVVKQSASVALSAGAQAYALNVQKGFNITATGQTLTLGDGNAAGLIFNGGSGSGLTGGTVAFGTAEAYVTISGSSTVSSTITGSGGFNLAGTGTLTLSAASTESGLVTVNSGSLALSAANVFSSDATGLLLQNTKNLAVANLTLNNSNQFAALNSGGNNSTVTINTGAVLTIGDTANNLSSTLSAAIAESGSATAGALTFDGAGLFDLSGISSGKLNLVAGSTILVNNTAQLRVVASEFSANSITVNLAGAGSQLQFAQNGGGKFADAITGAGELHLIGGTLQLTEATGANSYSGGTVVETGSTLDLTTNQVSTGNANITDAGGLIVFDQDFTGAFAGTISDGEEMGTGPMLSGSLDIDDSVNDNAGNNDVTLSGVQTYSGATYVEAGTLTLGVANAIEDSSGLTLGRVGGAVDGQTANLILGANNELTSLSSNANSATSVVLNGHTLTLDTAASISSVFGGIISDGSSSGNLVIEGTGVAELTGANTFTGGTTIDSGTLDLGAGGSIAGNVQFADDGTLEFATGTNQLAGTIIDTGVGDSIDLSFQSFAAGDHAVWSQNGSSGTLTIETSSGATLATLTLAGQYVSADFSVGADAQNDVLIDAMTPHIVDDFTADGISDALWRNSNGALAEWLMNGSAIASSGSLTFAGSAISPDSSWSVAGIGDFNGDGDADLLWRQSTTGSLAEWQMNGLTIQSSVTPSFQGHAVSPDSSWSVAGIGDFNGDGNADILWRQSTTGTLAEWLMNGSTITSSGIPTFQGSTVTPDSTWSIAGLGDFTGDGNADLLWRQSTTGALAEWQMNGSTITSSANLTFQGSTVTPDSSWSVVGIGDFNGDGDADVLWRQSTTGSLAVWLMNGSTIASSAAVTFQGSAVTPDSTWHVIEVGDFNGSSSDEAGVLWQQSTTGMLAEWQMNGGEITSSQVVTSGGNPVAPPSTWQVQGRPTNFT